MYDMSVCFYFLFFYLMLIDWIGVWNLMLVYHHISLETRNRLTNFIPHCVSHMRLLIIDISSLWEKNLTKFNIPAISVFTNITSISFPKLKLENFMFNTFSLKTGTAIIDVDSPFSPSQCYFFSSCQDLFLYFKDLFLGNIHTSFKACTAVVCLYTVDHKGIALVVYHHSSAQHILPTWNTKTPDTKVLIGAECTNIEFLIIEKLDVCAFCSYKDFCVRSFGIPLGVYNESQTLLMDVLRIFSCLPSIFHVLDEYKKQKQTSKQTNRKQHIGPIKIHLRLMANINP